MHYFSSNNLNMTLAQMDEDIDGMMACIEDEMNFISSSVDKYIKRCHAKNDETEDLLADKMNEANLVFAKVKHTLVKFDDLLQLLRNIKEVNKMVRFAYASQESNMLIKIPSYMDTIANVCLAQLKFIKSTYSAILSCMRNDIMRLWMDRDVAKKIKLILFVNHTRQKRFLEYFQKAEVLYADISLDAQRSNDVLLHQHIVLRMVSNRIHGLSGQQIIQTLFPEWDGINERVA
jgi:hypothetical protein